MAGYSAPGVYSREIDLSEILISQGISNGGTVVRAKKGPVSRPVFIQNDKQYIDTFGEPYFVSGTNNTAVGKLTPELGYGSYGAIQFLSESNSLFVFRAYDDDDKYGYVEIDSSGKAVVPTEGQSPTKVSEIEVFDTPDKIAAWDNKQLSNPLLFGAVGPGDDNNNIAVTVETLNPYSDWLYSYDEYPTSAFATSAFIPTNDRVYTPDYTLEPAGLTVSELWVTSGTTYVGGADKVPDYFPIASDVVKVSIYIKPDDKEWDDLYSNAQDKEHGILRVSPIEVFYGSLYPRKDSDGNDIFIETAINGVSQYVYVRSKLESPISLSASWDFSGVSATTPTWRDTGGVYVRRTTGDLSGTFAPLSGGTYVETTGGSASDADFWQLFDNKEELPVNILINPYENDVHKLEASKVCYSRKDCIVASQVGTVDMTDPMKIINDEKYGYPNPSYVALYSGYSKIYDKYNDREVYLPNSIWGASLMARVDNIAEPWYAPAGTTRGIMAVLDQNRVYNQDQIGLMYDRNINSVKYVRGVGFSMGGQKTAQMKKSALDRINVRRNLIYIETNIERSLNQFTFENNTQQTRLRVYTMIDNFLAGVLASDGLYSYDVVCDDSNNPPSVIDSNQLNVDIYVQPTKTVEYIQFTTVITRTGVSFSDVKLKYA